MAIAGTARGQTARRAVGFAGAFVLPWIACGFALADPDAQGAPGSKDAEKSAQERQLKNVEDTIRATEEQRRRIEGEIESARADRARLTEALIETTAKVQESERGIAAANGRLDALKGAAEALGASLEKRRGVIADVLAALQRMGSHPPPAILVRPQDMSEAVRAATVLGSVIPELKSETEALTQDMDDLAKTRERISRERDELAKRAAEMTESRAKLQALIEARQQSLADAQSELDAQTGKAQALASQAGNIRDLIGRLDSEIASEKANAAAAQSADQAAAAAIAAKAAAARGAPQRLAPEVAFADAKGRLSLPVAGELVKGYGAPDGYGGAEHGVSLATLAGAVVSSPADGSVIFSGPYRSYGQLLIINGGGGYYLALAGMERINVSVGQFVLAGEPVGAMGDGSKRMATSAAVGDDRPVLYIELRKDGAAIDPGPWWTKSDIEKARG